MVGGDAKNTLGTHIPPGPQHAPPLGTRHLPLACATSALFCCTQRASHLDLKLGKKRCQARVK